MSPRKNAQVAFASAVTVLLLSAIAAYVTLARLRESAGWVVHSYQVETTLGEIDSSIAKLARARSGYDSTGNEAHLEGFGAGVPEVHQKLQEVRKLTEDNARQQEMCTRLEDLIDRRISLFRDSIALKRSAPHDDAGQSALAAQVLSLAFENASIMQQMRQEEQQLLQFRMGISNRLYKLTVIILFLSFALALVLFFIHYRLLTSELKARALAETAAREGEASLRQLTSRLLQMQDEERRKFSRELHDSLGQYLVGVKMNLAAARDLYKAAAVLAGEADRRTSVERNPTSRTIDCRDPDHIPLVASSSSGRNRVRIRRQMVSPGFFRAQRRRSESRDAQ